MPVLSSRSRAESKRHVIRSGRLLSQLLVGSHVVKRRLRALQVILSLLRIIFACPAEDLQGLLVRRHGRFEPGGARLPLAEALEHTAEVILCYGPSEGHPLARLLFEGFLVRRQGRLELGGAYLSLAESPERVAEDVLDRGPIERISLARPCFQGFLVRCEGFFKRLASSCLLAIFLQRIRKQ